MPVIEGYHVSWKRIITVSIRHPRAGFALVKYWCHRGYWWFRIDIIRATYFRLIRNYRIHLKGFHPDSTCEDCIPGITYGKYPTVYFHCVLCGKHSPWATGECPSEKIVDEKMPTATGDGVYEEIAVKCPHCGGDN